MPNQFSVDSIEYVAEKLGQCRYLSDESLAYLTRQASVTLSTLLEVREPCLKSVGIHINPLQDASKFLRRCHRTVMIAEDFEFALKRHHVEVNSSRMHSDRLSIELL